jgi:hypothetical protein
MTALQGREIAARIGRRIADEHPVGPRHESIDHGRRDALEYKSPT